MFIIVSVRILSPINNFQLIEFNQPQLHESLKNESNGVAICDSKLQLNYEKDSASTPSMPELEKVTKVQSLDIDCKTDVAKTPKAKRNRKAVKSEPSKILFLFSSHFVCNSV